MLDVPQTLLNTISAILQSALIKSGIYVCQCKPAYVWDVLNLMYSDISLNFLECQACIGTVASIYKCQTGYDEDTFFSKVFSFIYPAFALLMDIGKIYVSPE